jgi:predicted RNA-binding Zn-ribbon protein involved in translation (DUF1610 family)
MSQLSKPQKYAAEWSKLKKWRLLYFGGILSLAPVLVGVSLLSTVFEPNKPDLWNRYPLLGLLIFVVLVGSSFIASFKYLNFECPRCGQVFGEEKRHITFNQCSHCDLRVGTDGD